MGRYSNMLSPYKGMAEDLKISLFVCRAMPKFEPVRRNPAETDELVEDKLWS